MKTFLIILSLFLLGCRSNNKQDDKIFSPSRKYYLTTSVNSEDKLKADYAHVIIHLFDSSGHLITDLNTNAGDINKWAVGWDTRNDTIILFSSDIGTFAWKIEQDSIKTIDLSDNIKEEAKDIMLKKYSEGRLK